MNATVNTTSNRSENPAAKNAGLSKIRRLFKDTRGASFVEYLVLVGVVALAGITAMQQISDGIKDKAKSQQDAIGKINSN